MSKYVDAERLRTKIAEQIESLPRDTRGTYTLTGYGMIQAFHIMRSIITSLQQEQTEFPSNLQQEQTEFPSNMDEAAIQAAQIDMCDRQIMEDSNENRMLYSRIFRRGFKAGAEWMAGQGVNIRGRVLPGTHGNSYVESDWFDKGYGGLFWNDEVNLTIRKKQHIIEGLY